MDPYEALTSREREVFQLVAEGYTSAEVAARLIISPRTVEMHRANLMRKMNLRSQTETDPGCPEPGYCGPTQGGLTAAG